MVLITPPPDGSSSSTGSGSTPEISPVAAQTRPSKKTRKPRFREDFPEVDETMGAPEAAAADRPQADDQMPASGTTPEPGVANAKLQQWLVLATAGLTGIALAVLVLTLLSGRGCTRRKATSVTTRKTPSDVPSDHDVPAKRVDDQTHATPGDGPKTPDDATQTTPPAAGGTSAPGASADQKEAVPDTSPMTAPPGTQHAGSDAESPPGLVPRDMPPATGSAQPNVKPAHEPAGPDRTEPPASGTSPDEAPPPTGSVDARLNMVILSEDFDQITLAEFVKFIRDLTALPVTLQLDAILAEGLTADTELAIHVRTVTVRQMIETALKPVALTLVIDDKQLVISTPAALSHEQEAETYAVGDLAADATRIQALADMISSLIAPQSWKTVGGPGEISATEQSLVVTQTSVVQFQVTRFLDRLRVARGLLPRGDLPGPLIDLRPVFVQAAKALEQPVSLHITQATPVAGILQRLEAETDLNILVNWRRVGTTGMTPRTESTLMGDGKPLRVLLNTWLGPAKLAFRVVDPRTIEISTQEDIDARLEVDMYRLKHAPKQDAEIAKLIDDAKEYVGSGYFSSDGGTGTLRYDSPEHCLIASLPQPRQRALAQWLADRE